MKILCLKCRKIESYDNANSTCIHCGHNFKEGSWIEQKALDFIQERNTNINELDIKREKSTNLKQIKELYSSENHGTKTQSKNKYQSSGYLDYFTLSLPKHHNFITSIVRLIVFTFCFLPWCIPFVIVYEGFKINKFPWFPLMFIFFGVPILHYLLKKIGNIKIGNHKSQKSRFFKFFKKSDYINEIERLSILKDEGIISEEEFRLKKKKLLI